LVVWVVVVVVVRNETNNYKRNNLSLLVP